VEEVIFTQRFNTPEQAQDFIDAGLRAQRIYRSLTEGYLLLTNKCSAVWEPLVLGQ